LTAADSIAVVISTYNRPDFLYLVLKAYQQQTDPNFVIYIADDGSGEETAGLIKLFRRNYPVSIDHIWHEDRGFRKAMVHNLAIRRIREPYILFTDGDCIPLPGLIEAHRRLAKKGALISGSRILLSRAWTERLCLQRRLPASSNLPVWVWRRLCGDVNRVFPRFIHPYTSAPHQRLKGIRGCHISCWREDILHVDGFDETYAGWGREDSDLVARLFHAGIRRRDLRGLPVLHLWHPEERRTGLDYSDRMLRQCLHEHRIRARKGLSHVHGDTRG